MMPVRSRSAALVVFAGRRHFDNSPSPSLTRFIPRISRGRMHDRLSSRQISESGRRLRDDDVSVLCGVLVPQRGRRTGVAGTSHELSSRGALRGGPRKTGAPQVVEVNFGAPKPSASGDSGGVERVASEPPALETSEKWGGRLRADEQVQVPFQRGQDVRRDADGSASRLGLRRTDVEPATELVRRSLDPDPRCRRSISRRSRPSTSPSRRWHHDASSTAIRHCSGMSAAE